MIDEGYEEQIKEYIYNAMEQWVESLREIIYQWQNEQTESLLFHLEESSEFDRGAFKGAIHAYTEILDEIRSRWKHYEPKLIESTYVLGKGIEIENEDD